MRFSSARCSRAGALVLVVVLLSGCVSRGTHRSVVAQRDARVRALEGENRDLGRTLHAQRNERDALLAESEDLRAQRDALRAEVAERDRMLAELQATYGEMVGDLERQLASGEIELERAREGLRMNLPQEVLFAPGSAALLPAGRTALEPVAARLVALGYRVEVMGHSDDRPIEGALAEQFPTNWELAGARASSVVRALQELGVDPDLLSAVSFGPYQPLASNETAEGRAQNRRIEIRLHPTGPVEPPLRSADDPNQPAAREGDEGA